MAFIRIIAAALLFFSSVAPVLAQATYRFEVGGHFSSARSQEFDEGEIGAGGRTAWRPSGLLGIEAEITYYPGDFPEARNAFSRGRWEGLFGATIGPSIGGLRVFGRIRPGFLRVQEAPSPLACIAIFPPPLACQLAAGATLLAVDVGGGAEVSVTEATVFRLDIGDRIVRYSGPVFDTRRVVHDSAFSRHDLRISIGAGWRF